MPQVNLRQLALQFNLPLLEVRLLAEHACGIARIKWMTQADQDIDTKTFFELIELLKKRNNGHPIAYLIGCWHFFGLELSISPDVLIPRPETEELVEHAAAWLQLYKKYQNLNKPLQIIDLGTGSGAIALALKHTHPEYDIQACDISPAALSIAKTNAHRLKLDISFKQSNWLQAYPTSKQFDLIISNPPYIVNQDPHLMQGDLRFEPALALTDFADGLSAYRAIALAARQHLRPEAAVWVEHGYHQQNDIIQIFNEAGLIAAKGLKDLSGTDRFVWARQRQD
jgi:release factor glutamine methyltransferase